MKNDELTASEKRFQRRLRKSGIAAAEPPSVESVPDWYFNLEYRVSRFMEQFPNSDVEAIRALYIRQGCK